MGVRIKTITQRSTRHLGFSVCFKLPESWPTFYSCLVVYLLIWFILKDIVATGVYISEQRRKKSRESMEKIVKGRRSIRCRQRESINKQSFKNIRKTLIRISIEIVVMFDVSIPPQIFLS